LGLGISVLLLPSLLALVPRGAAPLIAFAGLCAAGLVAATPPYRLASLHRPAIILGALILWGLLSAAWSIDPWRSLILDARLIGLFRAALALAAAAERIAAPRRLALFVLAGIAAVIVLATVDLASHGGVSQYITIRAFYPTRLNQLAAWLSLLLLPT